VLSVVVLGAVASADDTLWTRMFYDGQNTVPSRVRCGGTTAYVVAGISDAVSIYTMVLAYGDNGDLLWQKYINWHFADNPTALAVGADGNPVVGITAGSAWFTFLVKLTPSGDTVWTKWIPTSTPRGIAIDASNNIVVVGLRGPTSQDSLWLTKLDTYGNEVWSRSYRLGDWHTVNGVGLDAAGNIYVALAITSGGEVPMVVKSSGTNGDILWTRTPPIGVACNGVSVMADGALYAVGPTKLARLRAPDGETEWVTGNIAGALAKDVTHVDDGPYVTYASTGDFYIRKLNATQGRTVRSVRATTSTGDSPMSIAVDANGRPVVTGTATDTYYKALTVKFAAIPGVGEAGGQGPVGRGQAPARVVAGSDLPWQVERPGSYAFALRDGLGRAAAPVQRLQLEAGTARIPLPDLAGGVYFLTGEGPAGRAIQKVLVAGR
jgi:hypothetical protein